MLKFDLSLIYYMMKLFYRFCFLLSIGFLTSCATILQDEVAVKRTLGKLNDDIYHSGLRFYNPF
jgi:regulator of protease activity HflC (stomatin/prohibitin superfamily)